MVLPHRISSSLLVAVATIFIALFSQSRSQDDYYLPPTIVEQEEGDIYLDPRETTTLKCVADGKPDPTYSWQWNGGDLGSSDEYRQQEDGNLKFIGNVNGVDISDVYNGIYQCFAENDYGKAMGNKVNVQVAYLGKFDAEERTVVDVDVRDSAVLECNPPEGMPTPDIFWTYPQPSPDLLPYGERINQDPDGRLIFANVVPEDSRDYVCNAQSQDIGTSRFSSPINLNVDTESVLFGNRRAPMFVYTPSSSVTVLRTKDLRLKCLANAFPTPSIKWEKVGAELPEGRHSFDSSNQELVIYEATFADEGIYRCTASNGIPSSPSEDINVDVQAAPYWEVEPANQIVAPGSSAEFECIANGVPGVEMSWYVDAVPLAEAAANPRRKLSVDKTKMTFTDLQEMDSAVYVCQATNLHGEILNSALLHVQVIPAEVVEGLQDVTSVARGSDAELNCLVIGSPLPTVKWTFQNVDLEQPQDIDQSSRIVLTESDQSGGILHKLTIKEVTDDDQGTYKCLVENEYEKAESSGDLTVKDPTLIVTPPQAELVIMESTAVRLDCVVEHDSSLQMTVEWWAQEGLDQERVLVDLSGTRIYALEGADLNYGLVIEAATIGNSAIYTCVASTEVDKVEASSQLLVSNVPNPPFSLYLANANELNIDLGWLSPDPKNSPIIEYIVEYKTAFDDDSADWKTLTEIDPDVETNENGGHTYLETLNLSPWVTYNFRVRAENSVGMSEPSETSNPYTTPPGPPTKAPKDFRGLGTEPTNMVITWQALSMEDWNGEGFNYLVSWRPQGIGQTEFETKTLTEDDEPLVEVPSDLGTYYPYDIKVQAHNNEGSGPEATAIGYTGEDMPTDTPTGVEVEVLGPTEIKVTWTPVSDESVQGEHKGYMVEYTFESKAALSMMDHTNCTGVVDTCTLTDMQPYSTYSITVRVYNNKYRGLPSAPPVSAETPEGVPGPVSSMIVFAVDKGVLVKWEPPSAPNGILLGYTVKISKLTGTEVLADTEQVQELGTEARQHPFGSLEAGQTYRAETFAKTKPGDGESTFDEVKVRPSGPPLPPATPEAKATDDEESITVTWLPYYDASQPEDGPAVETYTVFYRKSDSSSWSEGKKLVGTDTPTADIAVEKGVQYDFRVEAANAYGTETSEVISASAGPVIGEQSAANDWLMPVIIVIIVALIIVLVLILIICLIRKNKGGAYPVEEKEKNHRPEDLECLPYKDDKGIYPEYNPKMPNEQVPLTNLDGGDDDSSTDSINQYDEDDANLFNEDGSFIGQYRGDNPGKRQGSGEDTKRSEKLPFL